MINYVDKPFLFLIKSLVGEIHKEVILSQDWELAKHTRSACIICLN